MNRIERDVIIVGAGPAGSICAAYLAKAGVDVLLLERDVFPREKACGSVVSEHLVRHLSQLEAADSLDRMSVFVNQLLMVSGGGSEALIDYECYGTNRRDLEQLLAQTAVSWGAEIRFGCRVTGLIRELGRICGVRMISGGIESEIRSKLVIGADGALSLIAKETALMKEAPESMSIGMSAFFEGVRLDRNIAIGQYSTYGAVFFDREVAPGYLWIMPSGDGGVLRGHCNVGIIMDYEQGADRDMEEVFADWLHRSTRGASMLGGARQTGPWRKGKQTYITQNMKNTASGLILIGDAASVMEPLWGDGLSAAADSARAAADAAWEAIKNNDFSDEALSGVYNGHQLRMGEAERKDLMKRIAILRETMKDPVGVDRGIMRIKANKELAKGLF